MQFPVRTSWFDVALLTAVAFFSFATIGALALAPKAGREAVAVVFAPWTSATDALSRSVEEGGRFVRFGAFDFIAIVEPSAENYARRVRTGGAWLVADPAALAACLKPILGSKS